MLRVRGMAESSPESVFWRPPSGMVAIPGFYETLRPFARRFEVEDLASITTLSFKDDTKLRGTPTICAETCPGEQHILDLTSRPWQGPPRSFFWCGGFPESGMRAPS